MPGELFPILRNPTDPPVNARRRIPAAGRFAFKASYCRALRRFGGEPGFLTEVSDLNDNDYAYSDHADSSGAVEMFDMEGSAVLDVYDWELTGIAGFRYGKIMWSDENGSPGLSFEGVGMTLGGEVRRMLRPSLAIVGRCRYSALYGEIKEVVETDDVADGTAVHGFETSIGVEWNRCTRAGLLTVGFGWEQQLYSSLSGNVDNDIDPEDVDITLAGPVFSIALTR